MQQPTTAYGRSVVGRVIVAQSNCSRMGVERRPNRSRIEVELYGVNNRMLLVIPAMYCATEAEKERATL